METEGLGDLLLLFGASLLVAYVVMELFHGRR